jgi:hypothetical protein
MAEDTTPIEYEWTLASFTDTIHRGGVALWAWSPSRRLAQLDGLCREFWGTAETVVPIDELFAKVNPEDRHGMMLDWHASATDPGPYSFDFRIGDGSDARWVSARGVGGETGQVGEWVQAIFFDITDRKRAEEAEHLLTAELEHRVSNMFTVARALTAIVAREAKSTPNFAEDLSRRFGVLHEATSLATRSHKHDLGDVRLQELAERILSPYRDGANVDVAIDGSVTVAPGRVNDYAMIFHELATNSAKYGALSEPV